MRGSQDETGNGQSKDDFHIADEDLNGDLMIGADGLMTEAPRVMEIRAVFDYAMGILSAYIREVRAAHSGTTTAIPPVKANSIPGFSKELYAAFMKNKRPRDEFLAANGFGLDDRSSKQTRLLATEIYVSCRFRSTPGEIITIDITIICANVDG